MGDLFFSPAESSFAAVLWCFFGGLVIGCCYLFLMNGRKKKYIGILFEKEAFSEEKAVLFEMLGFSNIKSAKNKLYAVCLEKDGKFYIPEYKRAKAEYIFRSGNAKWYVLLLSVVGLYAVMLLAHKFLPMLIDTNINFV